MNTPCGGEGQDRGNTFLPFTIFLYQNIFFLVNESLTVHKFKTNVSCMCFSSFLRTVLATEFITSLNNAFRQMRGKNIKKPYSPVQPVSFYFFLYKKIILLQQVGIYMYMCIILHAACLCVVLLLFISFTLWLLCIIHRFSRHSHAT